MRLLPCLPENCGDDYLESLLKSPAIIGFNMRDEPPEDAFAGLAREKAALREKVGDRLILLNLLPNYAGAGQLGADASLDNAAHDPKDIYFTRFRDGSYRDYVKKFLDIYSPDVLCYDFYAIDKDVDTDDEWMALWNYGLLKNLSVIAAMSLSKGIPFWSVLQAWGYNGKPAPDLAQLRWQLGLNFAFGAAGMLYFVYQNYYEEFGGPERWHDAPLMKNGEKTAEYGLIKRANAEFADFYKNAVGYEHAGVLTVNLPESLRFAVEPSLVLPSFSPVTGVDTALPLIAGCAVRGESRGLFVANASYKLPGGVCISLCEKRRFCVSAPFSRESAYGDTIRFSLGKGESAFVEIEE